MRKVYQISCVLVFLISVVFLLFKVESGYESSNIRSFSDGLWYSLVTLTTVGYGDFYPVTEVGKLIGLVFVLGSVGFFSLFIGKSTEFFMGLKEKKHMGHNGTTFENHAVVVGWNSFSRSVVNQLILSGNRVAVITDKKDDIDVIYSEYNKNNVFVLFSDLKNIAFFEKSNISKAYVTFVNVGGDSDKLILVINLRKEYPKGRFLVTLDDTDLKATFESLGVTFVLSRNEISSKLIASYIFEPDVAFYASDLISVVHKESDYDIQQYKVLDSSPFVNGLYFDVFQMFKNKYNVLLIGIVKIRDGVRELIKLPEDEEIIEENDYLIMIIKGSKKEAIVRLLGVQEGVLNEV